MVLFHIYEVNGKGIAACARELGHFIGLHDAVLPAAVLPVGHLRWPIPWGHLVRAH